MVTLVIGQGRYRRHAGTLPSRYRRNRWVIYVWMIDAGMDSGGLYKK